MNYEAMSVCVFDFYYIAYTTFMSLYLFNYAYICMFVSALSDPTSNSERSAIGGNKQILYCIVLYCISVFRVKSTLEFTTLATNFS